MKKLLVLICTVFLLIACDANWRWQYNNIVPTDKTSLCSNADKNNSIGDIASIYSFEYRGHKYIMFESTSGYIFVINDPDQ